MAETPSPKKGVRGLLLAGLKRSASSASLRLRALTPEGHPAAPRVLRHAGSMLGLGRLAPSDREAAGEFWLTDPEFESARTIKPETSIRRAARDPSSEWLIPLRLPSDTFNGFACAVHQEMEMSKRATGRRKRGEGPDNSDPDPGHTVNSTGSPIAAAPTLHRTRENGEEVIRGDFRSLMQLPAPDIRQHPAFQPNPMTARSDAPRMMTTHVPPEIMEEAKKWAKACREKWEGEIYDKTEVKKGKIEPTTSNEISSDKRRHRSGGQESPAVEKATFTPASTRKTSGFSLRHNFSRLNITTSKDQGPKDHDNEKVDFITALGEGSPMSTQAKLPETPVTCSAVKAGDTTDTAIFEGQEPKSKGMRISSLFKGKPGSDKPTAEPPLPDYTPQPQLGHQELELHLRRTLNCQSVNFPSTDQLPRHPTSSLGWKHRNLRCTNCVNYCCAVCGAACCAFKAAYIAARYTHKHNPENKKKAEEILAEINHVFPYGAEAPTFLQCTKGGDGFGCGRMVCPDCCGQCADEICRDIQCRKCKPRPWDECDWHRGGVLGVAI